MNRSINESINHQSSIHQSINQSIVGRGALIWFYSIADGRLSFLNSRLYCSAIKRLQLFLSNKLLVTDILQYIKKLNIISILDETNLVYIIYILAIAGQSAGPNWLKFFKETHG